MGLTRTAFPDAAPFTSMLSLDVERELGMEFDKARLHGESGGQRPSIFSVVLTETVVYGMSKE